KCTVIGLAIGGILLSAWPASAQVDIGLTPMLVEFPAVGGMPYCGALPLKNAGSVKTRVRAELLDLYVDQNTTPQFVAKAPAEADFSCRSWLRINPMEFELDGKRK